MQTLCQQSYTDHHQEAQRQYFEGGVFADEFADGFGGDEHDGDGDDHRGVHDPEFLYHTDGGDDGVDGEDQVQQDHLRQELPKRCFGRGSGWSFLMQLGLVVNLFGAFVDQK